MLIEPYYHDAKLYLVHAPWTGAVVIAPRC